MDRSEQSQDTLRNRNLIVSVEESSTELITQVREELGAKQEHSEKPEIVNCKKLPPLLSKKDKE